MTLNKAIEELIKRGAKVVNFTTTSKGIGITLHGDVWVRASEGATADEAAVKLIKANDEAEAANAAANARAAEVKAAAEAAAKAGGT